MLAQPGDKKEDKKGKDSDQEMADESGDKVVLSAGNNKIFKGTTTLTDITPAGYTPTANNWKIVNFNNHVYFFQKSIAICFQLIENLIAPFFFARFNFF